MKAANLRLWSVQAALAFCEWLDPGISTTTLCIDRN